MARVKCIMMQRDEDLLIEPWLRYYGYLFGFENLCVFDHGSVEPEVIATLRRYEKLGVEVRWDLTSYGDFHAKGTHFHNIIKHWDNEGQYDYVFPLDCDEFLGVFTDRGVVCSRAAIHAVLDGLGGGEHVFGFDLSLFNVPGCPGWFAADSYPKTFAGRGAIAEIDHGFHAIRSNDGAPALPTPFVYLHHHYKSFERTRQHARQKLDQFVEPEDIAALRVYTGPGLHLVKHFLMDEQQYLSQFDDRLLVAIPGFGELLEGLGIDNEALVGDGRLTADGSTVLRLPKKRATALDRRIKFDPGRYAELNPDVAAGGNQPLKHYLVYGHKEGRKF